MDPELLDKLLGANTMAVGAFEGAMAEIKYAPITDFRTDPRGLVKFFASADGKQWERFDGEFKTGRLVHRTQVIKVDLFGKMIEIPRQDWEKLLAWLGSNYGPLLRDAMSGAVFKMEEELDKLVYAAISGVATPNLYHDTLFIGEGIQLPGGAANPGGPARLTNKAPAQPKSAEGLKAAYYAAKKLFTTAMQKPDGTRYHNGQSMGRGVGIMFPTSAEPFIDAAFDRGVRTSRDVEDKITSVKTFVEMPSWDDQGINGCIIFPLNKTGRLMPLQVVRTTDNVKVETDMPGSRAESLRPTAEQMRLQKYSAIATHEFEVGPGSPYGLVWAPFVG